MSIKLICLDIDGTLVDDNKNIPPANLEEIRRAASLGIRIAITSGRISPSTQHYMKQLGITGAVSSLGGAMLENENHEIIEEYTLDRETCSLVNELANSNGMTLYAYYHYHWYADGTKASPYWMNIEKTITTVRGIYVNDLQKEVLDKFCPNKFLVSEADYSKAVSFLKLLQDSCDPSKVKFFMSGPTYIEVMHPDADKGNAIRGLCRYYGLDKSEVMVCGDYYNDVFMFREAGISVAAANAPDDVKSQATYVTKLDNNQGVVADAIRHFIP